MRKWKEWEGNRQKKQWCNEVREWTGPSYIKAKQHGAVLSRKAQKWSPIVRSDGGSKVGSSFAGDTYKANVYESRLFDHGWNPCNPKLRPCHKNERRSENFSLNLCNANGYIVCSCSTATRKGRLQYQCVQMYYHRFSKYRLISTRINPPEQELSLVSLPNFTPIP